MGEPLSAPFWLLLVFAEAGFAHTLSLMDTAMKMRESLTQSSKKISENSAGAGRSRKAQRVSVFGAEIAKSANSQALVKEERSGESGIRTRGPL